MPHSTEQCGNCLKSRPAFDQARAAWAYQNPITGLIQRFKFGGDLAAGRVLAGLFAERIAGLSTRDLPELIMPVPLFRNRLWQRGFNQSELLCRDLARRLDLDWNAALIRTRSTRTQSELPAKKRTGNVAGAFALNQPADARHVAIVDDVMTTGATLNECAKVLKQAGATRVDVWVMARA